MSNIFCSQCGAKHSGAARFCSACGTPLTAFATNSMQKQQSRLSSPNIESYDEENEGFTKPLKLDYEIQSNGNNVYKAEDLVNAPPVNREDRLNRPIGKQQSMTKEEYLAKSLKECGPTERHVIE